MDEMHRGQGMWKGGQSFHVLSKGATLAELSMRLPTQKVFESSSFIYFKGGFITQVCLLKLNHWPLVMDSTSNPPLVPGGEGDETESFNHLFKFGSLGNLLPSSYLIDITRATLIALLTQGIPRLSGTMCQEWGRRPNTYFL